MADTDSRSSLPSSESCDKWMPSEEDICPTGTIKWNHNCMHQQRILSLRQFCPTTNHFLFIGIILFRNIFPPVGTRKERWGGFGSVAQGSLPTAGIATVLTKLIGYEDKQEEEHFHCQCQLEEKVSSTAFARQYLFPSERPATVHLPGMQLHTGSAEKHCS